MIGALILGTLLAVGSLSYVLFPLFFGLAPLGRREAATARRQATAPKAADEDAVAALREIEFDRATGKLSESDYAELKARYTHEALAAMRARDARRGEATDASGGGVAVATGFDAMDPTEALIRRARGAVVECPTCGPRPEPDAAYCSDCGTFLAAACARCGAKVEGTGASFCADCGTALAA